MKNQLTTHAQQRLAQRGIPTEAIDAALKWGQQSFIGGGCQAFFLGKREIALATETLDPKWADTLVVVGEGDAIITAYKCRNPHQQMTKRVPKRRRKKGE
jgi:hypothetical protein